MEDFNISFPTEIWFGKKQMRKLGTLIKNFGGTKVLITYGGGSIKKTGIYEQVIKYLTNKKIDYVELSGIQPNPRITSVREGIKLCRENNVNFILAVGGGSVIDCSKAIACGFFYDGDPWDIVIRKAKITDALPIGVILTIAATGSETNENSMINSADEDQRKYKIPITSPLLKPKFSILNPEFTMTVPTYQTAAGVADIMSHAFEQYFSTEKITYLQDKLAEAILKTCIKYGPIALKEPKNYTARAEIMLSSTIGLNGLLQMGKTGDWATHTIEHVLSAFYDVTHGAGLAVLTPHWMEYILNEETVDRFVSLSKNIWNIPLNDDKFKMAKEGINKYKEFLKSIGMPATLRELSIGENQLETISKVSVLPMGQIGYAKLLKKEDVLEILKAAF